MARRKGYRKYGNKKVLAFGTVFDSRLEYDHFLVLLEQERAGTIADLKHHPGPFEIVPRTKGPDGRVHRAGTVTPDFGFTDVATGIYVIEDTKGVVDAASSLRLRMLAALHPHWIVRIVKEASPWTPVKLKIARTKKTL